MKKLTIVENICTAFVRFRFSVFFFVFFFFFFVFFEFISAGVNWHLRYITATYWFGGYIAIATIVIVFLISPVF